MGITAHVYADTFSHYGFSGVSSRGNKVDNGSFKFHEEVEGFDTKSALEPTTLDYLVERRSRFFMKNGEHGELIENINSLIGEAGSGALGHGSVTTYPDMPYLILSFEYEDRDDSVHGKTSIRNIQKRFSKVVVPYIKCSGNSQKVGVISTTKMREYSLNSKTQSFRF